MSAPLMVRPVPVPAEVMKRLRENAGPTFCPSCGEGENETTDGRESRRELCRMCAMAFEVEILRDEVKRLTKKVAYLEGAVPA